MKNKNVQHPQHYGGGDNPFEAIKVIEAWGLGFHLGNTLKYISRAGKKDPSKTIEDLEKALWYAKRYIQEKPATIFVKINEDYNDADKIADAWGIENYADTGSADFWLRRSIYQIHRYAVNQYESHQFDSVSICCQYLENAVEMLKK